MKISTTIQQITAGYNIIHALRRVKREINYALNAHTEIIFMTWHLTRSLNVIFIYCNGGCHQMSTSTFYPVYDVMA